MQLLGVSHELVLSYEVRPSAVEIIGQISKKGTNIKAITFAMEIRLIFLYGSTYKSQSEKVLKFTNKRV